MRKSCNTRRDLLDYIEEDSQVRKNLSRLIKTVQHIPSTRTRLDTNSLWNLVGELESFRPPSPVKSMQFTHKTTKKSFSRKYLNLRLYPSPDRSTSPDIRKTGKKSEKEESRQQKLNDSEQRMKTKKPKKSEGHTEISRSNRDDDKSKKHKNCLLSNNSPDQSRVMRKKGLSESEKENSKALKAKPKKISSRNNLETKFFRPAEKKQHDELKNYGDCVDSVNKKFSNEPKRQDGYKVLDKVGYHKNSDSIKTQSRYSRAITPMYSSLLTKQQSKDDQSSMVKTLTCYWNSLLNNELDDKTPSQESFDVPEINKSLRDLARNIYHRVGKENKERMTPLIELRHESDSNVNILDKIQSLSDFPVIGSESGKSLKQDESTESLEEIIYPKLPLSLSRDCIIGPNKIVSYDIEQQSNVQDTSSYDFQNKWNIKTENAIEVMQKIIGKLKLYPEQSLTSDQVCLSRSVKTMLCLVTATVLSSSQGSPEEGPDFYISKNSEENKTLDDEMNLEKLSALTFPSSCNPALLCGDNGFITKLENTLEGSQQLVHVGGITLRKVEHALAFYELCKELFRSNSVFDQTLYSLSQRLRPRCRPTFTLVFEKQLVLENLIGQQEFDSDSEEESRGDNSRVCQMTCLSFRRYLGKKLESLINSTADLILYYWPNSVEDFIRCLYNATISVLVWWIIAKEIFFK